MLLVLAGDAPEKRTCLVSGSLGLAISEVTVHAETSHVYQYIKLCKFVGMGLVGHGYYEERLSQ